MPRLAWWLPALVALGACEKDLGPPCRIAQSVTMPASALTRTRDVTLVRAGAAFALVGVDGDTLRWAPLSVEGAVGTESSLTLPPRMLGPAPWFGATAQSAPGDQLVVAYVVAKAPNQLQVVAVAQSPGQPPSAPVVLTDLPAGVDPKIVRLAMGTSQTGRRAVLTWGFEGQDAPPQYLMLGAGAAPTAPAAAVYRGPLRWSCLGFNPSRTDFAISLLEASVTPGGPPTWRTFELKDDGGRGFDVGVGFDTLPTGCVTAAPTSRGYLLAYQNDNGTFYSDYDIDKSVVNSDIVAGVLQFGGLARQPRVALVTPMGGDFTLLFDRPQLGGEVWRIDAFGNPQGGRMLLPSTTGQGSSLSAVALHDALQATYLDGPAEGTSSANSRMFVRVDCPLSAPAFAVDAAAPAPPDAGADGAAGDGK